MDKSIKYTRQQIENSLLGSETIGECIRKLGLSPKGGNYRTFKKHTTHYGIDISTVSMLGMAWLKGKKRPKFYTRGLEDILVENSTYQCTSRLKQRLIAAGLLVEQCAECGLTHWREQKLSLHLDHINGDVFDNRLENLRLLCPNCHSLTHTYCGKNNQGKKRGNWGNPDNLCPVCGKKSSGKLCSECYKQTNRTKFGLPREELERLVWEKPLSEIGKMYDISDRAVGKWCKKYNIQCPPRGYWVKRENVRG